MVCSCETVIYVPNILAKFLLLAQLKMNPSSRPHQKVYLAIYSFVLFNVGCLTGSVGPIIPFLSQERGRPQTQYSFLFEARAVGGIFGLLLIKFVQKRFQFYQHHLLRMADFCMAAGMIMFVNWKTTLGEFLSFLIFGTVHYLYNTLTTIGLVHVAKQRSGSWIPFSAGLHAVGAITSPILIGFLGVPVYYVLAAINTIIILLCSVYPTPTLEVGISETKMENTTQQVRYASWRVQLLIALGYLFDLGVTVPGWFPSYAVLSGSFDEKEASFVGTSYWVTTAVFRFGFAAVKKKNSQKLTLLSNSIVLCGFTCLILHQLTYYRLTTVLGSLWYGFSCSACFAILIAVPIEFGLKIRPQQISNIMFVPILSFLLQVGPIGTLMGLHIDNLFYALLTVGVIFWVNTRLLFKQMAKEAEEEGHSQELKQMILK